jgi:hypothetical protein
MTSNEFSTVVMPGFSSCCCWNGGTLNARSTSPPPLSSAMVASGGGIDTVKVSSLAKFSEPNVFAAAICSMMAWIETLTAGTAMRSVSLMSASDLIAGLRVLSRNGCEDIAAIPRTSFVVPFVFDHNSRRPGAPPDAMSMVPDSKASLTAAGPLKVSQETVTSDSPSARACFSMSC